MGEPKHPAMHNFAYDPSVASWVHSTTLAQFDGPSDETPDSPDAFYKNYAPPEFEAAPVISPDMTTTRQRQQLSNGAVRSTPKATPRSASGPATSSSGVRSTPQIPVNRPTVRSLAQKFNQPSSAETSPPVRRMVRPRDGTRESSAPPTSASSSPARPAKEASYGSYKFNNLKPRERPQPAPATPASTRRTNGSRGSIDHQLSPSRTKISTPNRSSATNGRQPFFGEVVGAHDASTPGFGIPTLDPNSHEPTPTSPTIKLVPNDSHSTPEQPRNTQTPRRRSPPSRIPVPSRRLSTASDSTSSNRSYKVGSARTATSYNRTSPTRVHRRPVARGDASPKRSKAVTQTTLPAVSYRGYRERGKSPMGANGGPSVAAVITAPLQQPTSPRLRNSRERQLVQESPGSRSRSSEPHPVQGYFGDGHGSTAQHEPHMTKEEHVNEAPNVQNAETTMDRPAEAVTPTTNEPLPTGAPVNDQESNRVTGQQPPLSLHTSSLDIPQAQQPLSSTTDFEYEESPVLGMPGSFMMTPPLAQASPPMQSAPAQETESQPPPPASMPEGELLQARAFEPPNKGHNLAAPVPDDPQNAFSELGVRESIPIMLGSDAGGPRKQATGWANIANQVRHSPRLSIGDRTFRSEPLDASGTISYLEEDDSPIDPFANRSTLRPDDSASVAFYRQAGRRSPDWTPKLPNLPDPGSMTLDSEAYSVINSVLKLYHESDRITTDIAWESQKKVANVSPIIAQYQDWGSKEATETYLARLLSDAAGAEEREVKEEPAAKVQPSHGTTTPPRTLSIAELEEDPDEPHAGGTAIIFPPESRRYSRESRGSTTTTIIDDASRADSSSEFLPRDHLNDLASFSNSDLRAVTSSQLSDIGSASEGLGLSLQPSQQPHALPSEHAPPRPPYSPPPPPQPTTNFPPSNETPSIRVLDRPSSGAAMGNCVSQPHEEADLAREREALVRKVVNDGGSTDVSPTDTNGAEQPEVSSVPQGDNAEAAKLKRRFMIIQELLSTEHNFCIDMMIAHTVFEKTAEGQPGVLTEHERKILFSNCKELEKFSYQFFRALKKAAYAIVNQERPFERGIWINESGTSRPYSPPDESIKLSLDEPYDLHKELSPENDRNTSIGKVMLDATPKMERLYTTYFLTYDDACTIIKKHSGKSEYIGYVAACFSQVQAYTNAWDLDSLLVKPCQRMLKYPLLLAELAANTPADHPDLQNIIAAKDEIKNISDRINQAKKRQETLRAATSEGKKKEKSRGFGDRIGKSVVKAFTPKQDRSKTYEEASKIFKDDEYDPIAQKFGGHFFQLQIVKNDLQHYTEAITDAMIHLNTVLLGFVAVSETGPSAYPEVESTWRRWAMGHFDLQNKALEEHKAAVRARVGKPLEELWAKWSKAQLMMEKRKKGLVQYVKCKQLRDRGEKIDAKLELEGENFMTINDALKHDLPKLYKLTKECVRTTIIILVYLQKDWYKTCSKKILPLLESEPQHTTSIAYDFKSYVDRFRSDWSRVEAETQTLAIVNHNLLTDVANLTSPVPTFYSDDTSSRKSSSRRTESVGSDMSLLESKNPRNSSGYGSRSGMRSLDGPPRSTPPDMSTIVSPGSRARPGPSGLRDARALSPVSDASDATVTNVGRASGKAPARIPNLDGAFDDYTPPPPSLGSSFLPADHLYNVAARDAANWRPPIYSSPYDLRGPSSSGPSSSRTSGVFNSALPMSDSPSRATADEPPATPGEIDEPEVLFLAASLFEFNIAHDRREGGIPYLVYVPGEIFDVIGMKGELWLARNQDDESRTVGWIWEKHFARILPEDS